MPPIPWLLETVAYGFLLPAAVAAAVVVVTTRVFQRRANGALRIAGAGAIAGGFFVGYALNSWAPLKPDDSWNWLPYLAVLAVLVGLVDSPSIPITIFRWVLVLGVASMAAWLLVPALPDLESARPLWLATVGASVFCLWALLDLLTARSPESVSPVLLLVVAIAAAAVLEFSGNGKFMQLAGILAVIFVVLALLSYWYPNSVLTRGALPGFAILLPGLVFNGHFNSSSDIPVASYLLVVGAPLLLWIGAIPLVQHLGSQGRKLVPAGAVLVALGLAVTLAALYS